MKYAFALIKILSHNVCQGPGLMGRAPRHTSRPEKKISTLRDVREILTFCAMYVNGAATVGYYRTYNAKMRFYIHEDVRPTGSEADVNE